MPANHNRCITVDEGVIFLYALFLLLIPLHLLLSWILAAFIHELGHILMLKMLKTKIYMIHIGVAGAKIVTEPMTPLNESLCSVAGPISGFLTLLLWSQIPYVALLATIQSLYNLLPVFPLDGGRAFLCLLLTVFPEHISVKISNLISFVTIIASGGIGLWISVTYALGGFPILFPALPLLLVWKNTLQRRKKNSTIRKRK